MSDRRTVACVVGARPNFVKLAPVLRGLAAAAPDVRPLVVHTGQHYDAAMSDRFFEQLGLAPPDVHLDVGSGTHGAQTARVLERYEAWLLGATRRPLATVVVGDVNSTLAAALASVKLGIPVVHVEAGLRSFDRRMPEEVNRVLTDAVSDLMLASEPSAVEHLRREGRPDSGIRLVGNVMIDVLRQMLPVAQELNLPRSLGLEPRSYFLWTLHRPENVDDRAALARCVDLAVRLSARQPVVFPVHPRTRQQLYAFGLWHTLEHAGVLLTPPLGYIECLSLSAAALAVVTDSGGLQEEASALEVPCLTLRQHTERPITVAEGTNTLVGGDVDRALGLCADIAAGTYKRGHCPVLWDGRAGERVGTEIGALVDCLV